MKLPLETHVPADPLQVDQRLLPKNGHIRNDLRVSVIVPTLEEAPSIGGCLEALATQDVEEVIVSDAGSEDGTAELAARRGARVLIGSRGRGIQQNRGASEATGDLLLFLHADCRLEAEAVDEARRFFRRAPRVPAACFRMTVQARDPLFRCINAAAHLRAGVFGYPYGDQGLVIPRWAFEQVGGFPELPLMEHLYLARELRPGAGGGTASSANRCETGP